MSLSQSDRDGGALRELAKLRAEIEEMRKTVSVRAASKSPAWPLL
jgi:hypothetical protein